MEGVLRFNGRRNYFVLWRMKLYHWKNRPEKRRFSNAWKVYLLSTLENLETDPSQRHVLILKFPKGRIELSANNPGSYQAWLSCFAVFHVRNSLDREAPYLVSSTYIKAIWAVLDHVHWRGCQTRDIFLSKGNENSVEVLQQELLIKGPGHVDPQDYRETTVATVVKIFLDALPESLWTEQALNEFRKSDDINSNSVVFVIASLPEQNSELLKKLFITLSSVATNVSKSKVNVEDLVRVMTPTLDSRDDPLGKKLEKVTELCIRDYQHLFFGAPLMVVVVPKIEDILTYKRMDFSIKKRKKKYYRRHPRGNYKDEPMPKHEVLRPEAKSQSLLQLSSDDESSDSHSISSLKHIGFLRPQFKNEYSPKKSSEFGSQLILTDLPEVGPLPDVSAMSQSMLTLATSMDNKIDEKSIDDQDSFGLFQNISTLLPSKDNWRSSDRARSMSVNFDQNIAGETSDQYNSRNIREVVGKRRAAKTRLVKSLVTDSFFVYAYLSEDDRTLNLDGLFRTRSKRHSFRHRIQVPIAEDEEYENYQKDLIEQNKITEFLEVFGPSQTSKPILPSLLKKV